MGFEHSMALYSFIALVPGVVAVAILGFPAFFFLECSIAFRLVAACGTVACALFLFRLLIGHEFVFWRLEDIPVWVVGLTLAWLSAKWLARRRSKRVSQEKKMGSGSDST